MSTRGSYSSTPIDSSTEITSLASRGSDDDGPAAVPLRARCGARGRGEASRRDDEIDVGNLARSSSRRPPPRPCSALRAAPVVHRAPRPSSVEFDRRSLLAAACAAPAAGFALSVFASADSPPLSFAWTATDGFSNATDGFITFDEGAYAAMRDDESRTPIFEAAIKKRLAGTDDQVVVDIGTGPYALLAIMAARAGAKRVYAIEAEPEPPGARAPPSQRRASAASSRSSTASRRGVAAREGGPRARRDCRLGGERGGLHRDDPRRAGAAAQAAQRPGVVDPAAGADARRAGVVCAALQPWAGERL